MAHSTTQGLRQDERKQSATVDRGGDDVLLPLEFVAGWRVLRDESVERKPERGDPGA